MVNVGKILDSIMKKYHKTVSIYDSDNKELFVTDNPAKIGVSESEIIIPVDIQTRYAQTIQTHNAVSVVASGNSSSPWFDCSGFDKIAVMGQSNQALNWGIEIHWSDDSSSQRGLETLIAPSPANSKIQITDVKAKFFRVVVKNTDATTSQIISTYTYLKA